MVYFFSHFFFYGLTIPPAAFLDALLRCILCKIIERIKGNPSFRSVRHWAVLRSHIMDIWQEGKSLIDYSSFEGFCIWVSGSRLDCAYWTQSQDIVIVVSSSQVASWHMAQNIPFVLSLNTNQYKSYERHSLIVTLFLIDSF